MSELFSYLSIKRTHRLSPSIIIQAGDTDMLINIIERRRSRKNNDDDAEPELMSIVPFSWEASKRLNWISDLRISWIGCVASHNGTEWKGTLFYAHPSSGDNIRRKKSNLGVAVINHGENERTDEDDDRHCILIIIEAFRGKNGETLTS